MNSYTDKDLNKITFIALIGCSISLALLFTLVPFIEKHEDRIDKLESMIFKESE